MKQFLSRSKKKQKNNSRLKQALVNFMDMDGRYSDATTCAGCAL